MVHFLLSHNHGNSLAGGNVELVEVDVVVEVVDVEVVVVAGLDPRSLVQLLQVPFVWFPLGGLVVDVVVVGIVIWVVVVPNFIVVVVSLGA